MATTGEVLRAPFPWFGGKSRAAPIAWEAFGSPPNYVEPFFGSGAVLLQRPGGAGKVETVNDLDGFVANFWRAVAADPEAVAHHQDWPVNEMDLHARHGWLVRQEDFRARMLEDPAYYDAKIAGWWVWGISAWIGNGWCSRDERLHHCLPKVGTPGHGVHAPSRKKPRTHRGTGVHRSGVAGGIGDVFEALRERMRHVRVACGDWERILGSSTLGIDTNHGMTPCAVFLDPPYPHRGREKRLYREDDPELADRVRAWALEHGDDPRLRIILCGYEAHWDMPASWRRVRWKSQSGFAKASEERLWLSPHCVRSHGPLFAGVVG